MSEETSLRRQVVETAQAMSAKGLSPQRSGNVSVRTGNGILVTPTGLPYADYEPDDMVKMSMDGTIAEDQKKPSSEAPFHLAIYNAFPDAEAIVHCHSMAATALACARMEIPAFHYMVAVAGGVDSPCVPYATFGTQELSDFVAKGLAERDACLMANHGQIAIGRDLGSALELAHEVEVLSEQYVKLLSLGVEPILLGDAEMAEVLDRFKGYGQKAQG